MIIMISDEIRELLNIQPGLTVVDNDIEFIIKGLYKYSLDYDGYIVQGERNIRLIVQKNFPSSIPKFYLNDYPECFEHIYKDGNACLATIGEIINFLSETPSLIGFIKRFVNSFIYTIEWFEKYKTFPFDERKHGYQGLLDYYLYDLNLSKKQYNEMVLLIYNKNYKGHIPCICGSGKKLRDCHGKYILPIITNALYRSEFLYEAYMILTEDGKNVGRKSSK